MKIAYWVFCARNTTKNVKLWLLVKYILFGFQTSTEYEYEYYSGLENQANTNTNIFGFEKSSEYEYEYYSVWKYLPNTNTNITIRSQLFEYYSNTELFAHLCCAGLLKPASSLLELTPSLLVTLGCITNTQIYKYTNTQIHRLISAIVQDSSSLLPLWANSFTRVYHKYKNTQRQKYTKAQIHKYIC